MVRLSSLFTALVTLSVAFANPIVEIRDNLVTLPIVKRINSVGAKNFLKNEQARAAYLVAAGRERAAARAARARGETVKVKRQGSISVANTVVSAFHIGSSFAHVMKGGLPCYCWCWNPSYRLYAVSKSQLITQLTS